MFDINLIDKNNFFYPSPAYSVRLVGTQMQICNKTQKPDINVGYFRQHSSNVHVFFGGKRSPKNKIVWYKQ